MRISVFLDSIGITPDCSGHSWTEVCDGLQAQYASIPLEQRREARVKGRMLIREKSLEVISAAIIVGPSQPKRSNRPPKAAKGTGKRLQKCDRCRSWGFKSIWDSQEAAEEFCAGTKDLGLNAYPCPHGNGWHIGHRRGQNKLDA